MKEKVTKFVKKLNGTATYSEPSKKLTNQKINRICNTVKLPKTQTVKKILK